METAATTEAKINLSDLEDTDLIAELARRQATREAWDASNPALEGVGRAVWNRQVEKMEADLAHALECCVYKFIDDLHGGEFI